MRRSIRGRYRFQKKARYIRSTRISRPLRLRAQSELIAIKGKVAVTISVINDVASRSVFGVTMPLVISGTTGQYFFNAADVTFPADRMLEYKYAKFDGFSIVMKKIKETIGTYFTGTSSPEATRVVAATEGPVSLPVYISNDSNTPGGSVEPLITSRSSLLQYAQTKVVKQKKGHVIYRWRTPYIGKSPGIWRPVTNYIQPVPTEPTHYELTADSLQGLATKNLDYIPLQQPVSFKVPDTLFFIVTDVPFPASGS